MKVHKNLDDIELHQDKIKNLKNVIKLMDRYELLVTYLDPACKDFYDARQEIKEVIHLLEQDQINVEWKSFGWILPH